MFILDRLSREWFLEHVLAQAHPGFALNTVIETTIRGSFWNLTFREEREGGGSRRNVPGTFLRTKSINEASLIALWQNLASNKNTALDCGIQEKCVKRISTECAVTIDRRSYLIYHIWPKTSRDTEIRTAKGPGALECNLTGRCPTFKNLHNPFRGKICISIPFSGIIRLQKIPKTIGKTIAYSWTNSHSLFRNFWSIFIPRSGIYAEKWYPEKRHLPYRFIWKCLPPPPGQRIR